jgi:HPt (histidine-containing phosphotransfer) domain-containing protein
MTEGKVYVDTNEGLKRVLQNVKLYLKLLNKFKVDFSSKPDDIIAALAAGHNEEAQVLVHTLKGTASNLALTELYNKTVELELQIKNAAVDSAASEAVKLCFADTVEAIDMVIKQYG